MSKNQKIKDSKPGAAGLLVQMKKLQKKLNQSAGKLEENIQNIEKVDDEQRKMKVQSISNELFDITETLHDLNLGIDEVIGDDMLHLDENDLLDKFEALEIIPALVEDLQKYLKNFHKTYYDKDVNNDLKFLTFNDLERHWKSLNKNLAKILGNLAWLIQKLS